MPTQFALMHPMAALLSTSPAVCTTEDFPAVPKGAVLQKVGDNYVHATGFWLSAKVVEADPVRFPVSDEPQQ